MRKYFEDKVFNILNNVSITCYLNDFFKTVLYIEQVSYLLRNHIFKP